jgi:hypothetical protein
MEVSQSDDPMLLSMPHIVRLIFLTQTEAPVWEQWKFHAEYVVLPKCVEDCLHTFFAPYDSFYRDLIKCIHRIVNSMCCCII